MDKEEIIKYCLTLENTYKDCPFSDDFESVTMKHCKNKKWFALLMNVNNTSLEIATIITFTSTVVCAIIVTIKEVKGSTAELMRPKAPREGKQVFLEKVPGFWERLSFLFKISIRNIFRYKRRLFMTIIGIAGCTALVYRLI